MAYDAPNPMDFDLSPDQAALRDAAADLLDGEASPTRVAEAAEAGGFDRRLWDAMVAQGWLGVMVSEQEGGLGLGTIEAAVLLEQSGSHLAPVPLLQQLLALRELAGTSWTDGLLSGERFATATRRPLQRGRDGSVSGTTEPAIYGSLAELLLAPTEDGELVVVDLSTVDRSPEPAMDRTRQLSRLQLDDVPATTIGGHAEVNAHLDLGATFHAAELLGSAQAVMELAVDYAKVREQFGRPIGSFQAVKHRCADMLVDVEGMRSAAYYAAWAVGAADPEASVAAATAKIWCSDAGQRVAESALQVHGGIGFTWESAVHLYLKRIQLDSVAFGDAREHRSRLAAILRNRLDRDEHLV